MKRRVLMVLLVLGLGAVLVILDSIKSRLTRFMNPAISKPFLRLEQNTSWFIGAVAKIFPLHQRIYRRASKKETNSSAPNAQYVMVLTAIHPLTPVAGCIRVSRISHRPRYNNTPIENCFGL